MVLCLALLLVYALFPCSQLVDGGSEFYGC